MHYYKSQELADLYGVSRRTVTNWIKQTREGKLDLTLEKSGGEYHIVKSKTNQATIDEIVKKRRKYLNTRSRQSLTPSPAFYKLFDEHQIYDIIRNLSIHHELPLQYSYFGEGAKLWSDHFRGSLRDKPVEPVQLLVANMSYISTVLQGYKNVNVVDVGVGNGSAVKPLLTYLKQQAKLKRYIGIDLSPTMLNLALENISRWFNNEVPIEGYTKDISFESFGDIIAEPSNPDTPEQDTINLVLSLGGYISNFKQPEDVLRTINKSMGPRDVYLCNFKLDAPTVKHQLNFISHYQKQSKLILDLLGIKESLYKTEIGFDEVRKIRYARIRLKQTIKIEFKLSGRAWNVDFNKDETILTYRAHFNSTFDSPKELFFRNGFNPLLISQTLNHEGVLVIADLNTNEHN